MNAKWCVSTLIIILSLLGLSQGQTKVSNQQISVQFTTVELASETARKEVLETITQRLKDLGIDAVQIVDNDGSQVSVRYYSNFDASSVKSYLLEIDPLSIAFEDGLPVDFPNEQVPEKYSLIVSDLHQPLDCGLILDGNLVCVQKPSFNGFFTPVVLPFNRALVLNQNTAIHIAFKFNKKIALAMDKPIQTIQEVRAGPIINGNC